jgi:3-methyladenine DNA glycosylase AlkD
MKPSNRSTTNRLQVREAITPQQVSTALRGLANAAVAEHAQRFFKTAKGEYGEGDLFLGIRVPVVRQQANKYKALSLEGVVTLLHSTYHEERLCALLMLVSKYKRGTTQEKNAIYKLYLQHVEFVNHWDLVDCSALYIVGAQLFDKSRGPLYRLAKSQCLWERRIAIIATFYFIRENEFDETLKIAAILCDDTEDLIHKAVGWMLREVGKRDLEAEELFLKEHYQKMPRTMLRYAIEKFEEKKRKAYLRGDI